MLTKNYSNGKPGVEIASGIHQILRSNFSGAMRIRSVGTKESIYLLLEIRSRQLAYLVQLLQYSHELLGLCIGLQIQWRLSLMTKAQLLTEVTESWLLNGGPLSLLTDTSMPNKAKVLSIFSSSCQVTASGTEDFTIAMTSFLNSSTVSLSSNSAWVLLAWHFCVASGSGCSEW